MRPDRLVFLTAFLLIASSPGRAQTVPSFAELALRVNVGDVLRVEEPSGAGATGRLSRLTRTDMTIETDAGERQFARDDVRGVALRGHALRRGAIIGAVGFAVLGAIAVCSHDESGACALTGSLGAAPIGAGVGLTIGSLIPQMKRTYRAPASQRALPPSARSGGEASLLEDLGLWVNLDDDLRVEDRSGIMSTGRLTHLTDGDFTIQTARDAKDFTRDAVRRVELRRHPVRGATLIGAGAGAAYGALAWCTGSDRTECADGTIIWSALGAGAGTLVGLLVHRTTVVYPSRHLR